MLRKPTQAPHPPLAAKLPRKCRRSGLHSSDLSINMGKTNPVQENKRNESDECRRKTESVQQEFFEHGQQETPTVGEVQEQEEDWETTTSRAKRSRLMYSLENADVSKKSAHSQSLDFENSLKHSTKSAECNSSASNSEDRHGDQESEPSSGKKLKLTKGLESLNFNDKDGINTETRDHLDSEGEKQHQSSFASDFFDATMETVQLTINASPGGEIVPFVSLTSEAYGIAVMGYPLDVGEIRDGSDTSSLSKESVECKRFDKLIWRTSKRTPVCYVNVKSSILLPPQSAPVRREESLTKNTKQFIQDKTAKNKSCVPVKVIFSEILAAVD